MENPNDHIIVEVFNALLVHLGEQTPEFTFFNSMKMANMPIDNRMLANFIVQDFPWPIGVELRRLFSGDRKQRDKNRVEQILKVAERVTQFICFCQITQLWDECKAKELELSADFKAQVNNFSRPSFGTYVGIFRATNAIFEANNITPFLAYKESGINVSNLLKTINELVAKRNQDRHMQVEMDCEDGERLLKDLLKQTAFLAKFKLATVKEIKVKNPKLRETKFRHTIKVLNSQHEDFSSVEHFYDNYTDSDAVILTKNFTTPKAYLNLTPLIIDTSTILENQKVAGVKNGIYLYSMQKNGRFVYTHSSVPESIPFNEIPSFDTILEQFQDLQNILAIPS